MDKIRIVSLGGLDEFYKACLLVEINDDIFVVECGIRYPDITKPGIDYIIPRYDYLLENKSRVKGYILTHGHDSVIGALPYIIEKVPAPIFCSDITKLFLFKFCEHNKLKHDSWDIHVVKPDDDITISGRLIRLFSTCSNIANSFGIAFDTDQGNVVFVSNCIFDNNNNLGFALNINKIGIIASHKTLVLLNDSSYARNPGYTNPKHRILPLCERLIRDAQGRTIMALDAPDIYNIIATLTYAYKTGHKIILYDKSTADIVAALIEAKCLNVPQSSFIPMSEVNRHRSQELFILMTGFGAKLYSNIALLANHNNDEQIFQISEDDTFIIGAHVDSDSEIAKTDAVNQLYRTGCKINVFDKPNFLIMHSSAEDIKTTISFFRPRYYIPFQGSFVNLLANAKLALEMNTGFNHNNVFIIDNGNVVEFDNYFAKILPQNVLTGSLYVDGKGVGDVAKEVLSDRQKFSDDGVIILAATISKSKREIVLGPDIQTRGLVFVKESDSLMREIEKILLLNIKQELSKENYSITYLETNIKEQVFKSVRRLILKSPTIIPIIMEIE